MNMENLKWSSFKKQLQANPKLHLQFQYAENQWMDAAYHITEIKQAPITSVDCGGVMNTWTEVIIQLWEPENKQQEKAMHVSKALTIVELVEKSLPLNPDGLVKIEFGNPQFDTRQMLPKSLTIDGENLIIDLRPDTVQCKAIEKGGSCGTNSLGEECCTPIALEKPQIILKNLTTTACALGSGCC